MCAVQLKFPAKVKQEEQECVPHWEKGLREQETDFGVTMLDTGCWIICENH